MTESVQKWLERNRPPRVKITYDVETGGAIEKRELPFVVAVLADLCGDRDSEKTFQPYQDRQMLSIDRDNFNDVMKSLSTRVALGDVTRVPAMPAVTPKGASISETLSGDIRFNSIADFDPLAIVQRVPELSRLYRVRSNIRTLQAKVESADKLNGLLNSQLGKDHTQTRNQLNVLAGPDYRRSVDPADQATAKKSLIAAKSSLSMLALMLATAKPDDASKLTAATSMGFVTVKKWDDKKEEVDDVPATLSFVREFIGLFAVPKTDENLGKAKDQLTADSKLDPKADKTLQPRIDYATALLAALTATDVDVDADAQRAALVFLGLPLGDDSDAVAASDDPAKARSIAAEKQTASNRWFTNNLLLNLSDAGKESKAAVQKNIQMVLDVLSYANLKTDEDRLNFMAPLGYFVTEVLAQLNAPNATFSPEPLSAAIDMHVTHIDGWLSQQLSAIMHAPMFQKLEASWRGLYYFVSNTETNKMLTLGVFNATMAELLDDMDKAVDKDQSKLFKMIYEAQFGTFGGHPYNLLVGDYEIDRSQEKFEFLEKISEVAASAHAPFITSASSAMFDLKSFSDLAKPRDFQKIFENNDLIRWNAFRVSENSLYVTLVLPHVLLRLPYGKDGNSVDGLNFEETKGDSTSAPDPKNFLWGNAAYMLATRITSAFSHYNWTAAIRGVEGGGLVENLPLYSYKTAAGSEELLCPTEVSITDRREKELNDLGFISLCHCKGKGQAVFFGGQTSNQPKRYFSESASANAKIAALLPYLLAASRFAHYIKVIMRNKIGSFLTRGNVEAYLNGWIANYVLLDENASQDTKASYPLSQAKIVVTDTPGAPGSYDAVVFLRPHFQLEALTTSIRLVVALPG